MKRNDMKLEARLLVTPPPLKTTSNQSETVLNFFQAGLAQVQAQSSLAEECQEIFDSLDRDGDGKLSVEEPFGLQWTPYSAKLSLYRL